MRILAILMASTIVALAAPETGAQAAAPNSTGQAAIEADKAALLDRYFTAIGLRDLVVAQVGAMFDSQDLSGLDPDDATALVAAMKEASEQILPLLIGEFAVLYAEAFSLAELEGLVAFYEGPVGRSLMEKTRALAERTGDIFPRYQRLFEERVCARLGC